MLRQAFVRRSPELANGGPFSQRSPRVRLRVREYIRSSNIDETLLLARQSRGSEARFDCLDCSFVFLQSSVFVASLYAKLVVDQHLVRRRQLRNMRWYKDRAPVRRAQRPCKPPFGKRDQVRIGSVASFRRRLRSRRRLGRGGGGVRRGKCTRRSRRRRRRRRIRARCRRGKGMDRKRVCRKRAKAGHSTSKADHVAA